MHSLFSSESHPVAETFQAKLCIHLYESSPFCSHCTFSSDSILLLPTVMYKNITNFSMVFRDQVGFACPSVQKTSLYFIHKSIFYSSLNNKSFRLSNAKPHKAIFIEQFFKIASISIYCFNSHFSVAQ